MEIYLSCENEMIRFPVVPPKIGVDRSASVDTQSIIQLGEVAIWSGMNLKTIEFESFFPNQEYSFCDYTGFDKPYEFSYKIQKLMYDGKVCRIIVTGTPTNMECLITSFNTWEQDGTGDLYFSITLTEYKKIEVPKV